MTMTANPTVNFSGLVGTNALALGTDLSFDKASGKFTKYDIVLSFNNADLIASLIWNDKGDVQNASYYHIPSTLTNTFVGVELNHNFKSNENNLTIGTQHALDPPTLVKARVDNFSKASALIQLEWHPKSHFTISGEVDTGAIEKSASGMTSSRPESLVNMVLEMLPAPPGESNADEESAEEANDDEETTAEEKMEVNASEF